MNFRSWPSRVAIGEACDGGPGNGTVLGRRRRTAAGQAVQRPLSVLLVAVQAALLIGGPAVADTAPRPNVVVILADDLGYSDIGSYGGEIETANLDRLAARGLRFTRFYNTARCSPTRAALLTGVYPHEAGMGWLPFDWSPPGYTGALGRDVATLAELLRPAGYTSYLAGKWHLSNQLEPEGAVALERARRDWPLGRGFHRFFGTIAGSGNYFYPRALVRDDAPAAPGPDFYYTDAISEAAAGYIRAHRRASPGRPFFLYVAYTAPHWPLHAPTEDIERYRGRYDAGWDALRAERHERMRELGVVDARWPLSPRHPDAPAWEDAPHKAWQARRMEVYAAQVDRMDRGIGRVIDALEETGLLDDTLILFLSDNGGCAEELGSIPPILRPLVPSQFIPQRRGAPYQRPGNHPSLMPGPEATHQSYGLPWANASNTPFRLYKQQVHEGGIATPLIAHWPTGISADGGALVHALGHVVDIVPTVLELAGAAYPEVLEGRPLRPLRGHSLAAVLRGGGASERGPLFFEHQGNRAVIQGRFKLVSRWRLVGSGPWELYDLESDRTELNDLAEFEPERVAALRDLYDEYAATSNVRAWPWVIRQLRVFTYSVAGLASAALVLGALCHRRRGRRR